jgi:hypothetical protein
MENLKPSTIRKKLKEFVTTKAALQKILRGLKYRKRN